MKRGRVTPRNYKMPEPPAPDGPYITTDISIHGLEWFPVVTVDEDGWLSFHDCPGCRTLERTPDYPTANDHDAGHSITLFFESLENLKGFLLDTLETVNGLQAELGKR